MQPPIIVGKGGEFVGLAPGAADELIRASARLTDKPPTPEARKTFLSLYEVRTRHIWDSMVGARKR